MSTTTTVNAEVTGLESAIQYAKGMADSCRAGANSVEQAVAGLVAGEVRGDAIAHLTSAQDQLTSAATVFEAAAEALARQRVVKESYEAVPDAGSREFVTSE